MKKVAFLFVASLVFIPTISFAAFNQNLSYGSSGAQVVDLQNFLTTQGLYSGPITGNFFNLTKNALVAFQKQKGIQPASGLLGPITRGIINASLVSSTTTNVTTSTAPASPAPSQVSSTQNQQTSTTPSLPPPSAAEIAAVEQFCAIVEAQEGSQAAQNCSSSTFWNGYNSNAIFRNDIDTIVQQTLQQLSQQQAANSVAQQLQTYCAAHPVAYDPSMTPAANLLAEKEACGTATTADFTNYQLQQLQNSVNANTAAIQQQHTTLPQTPTAPAQTKCTTQPWWNAGVLQYTTTCTPSY